MLQRVACAVVAALGVLPAMAMRIVLTNDDGFESHNTQVLFTALKAAGHDVILSAPCRNQSGTSAQLGILLDIGRTGAPSPGGRIPAGSPGAGPTTIAPDQYYVDSSPASSVLYGIDVPGQAKWGAPPDLVVPGPNNGHNLGAITPHSGTVGAAVVVLNRGIPAIAVSAADNDPTTAPLLAEIVLRVIAAIEDRGKVTLPIGIGLNVNVPALDPKRTAASYRVAFTQIGFADAGIRYISRNADGSFANPLPAMTAGLPVDRNPGSETNAFADNKTVTVSPIQGTYQAAPEQAALVLTRMRGLFASTLAITNPKLINISVRGFVGAGSSVQIAGFYISGSAPKTVLIRAGGPALVPLVGAGTLPDPVVELFAESQLVATNDNWGDDAAKASAISAAAAKVGAFAWPQGSKDAALLVTLEKGSYTVVVRGVGNATGVALVEVYDVNVD